MNNRRQKVLLWYWGRRGGGPRYTYELARALIDDDEYELHLSLSRQSEIFDEFGKLNLPGWHVDTYENVPSAVLSSLKLPKIRNSFWNYVAEHKIDVVICTMSHLWNVPVLYRRSSKVPYLFVLHDASPHPGDNIFLRHWLLKKEVSLADGVVTLTEHVRKVLIEDLKYPSHLSWVVPHGVFPYAKQAGPQTEKNGVRKLLFFGRIMPYKGLDILLSAYRQLRQTRHDVELTISGPGDLEPYQAQLDGLPGITIDNRWIPEDEIGAAFQNADICVLPYREASQSGVIATAYAAGMPVITTPIGGLVEQVLHEQTGLICEAATPEAIADSVARLLDFPEQFRKYSQGATKAAEETLSWPVIGKQFGHTIDEFLTLHHKEQQH